MIKAAGALTAFGPRLKELPDLLFQDRKVTFHHRPDFYEIDTEIVMDQYMPHFDDFCPRYLRMAPSVCRGKFAACLTHDLDVVHHPGMNKFVRFKGVAAPLGVALDLLDGM